MWLAVLLLASAFAADPCKKVKTKEDPFFGSYRGGAVGIGRGNWSVVGFAETQKNGPYIEMKITYGKVVQWTMKPGDKLELALGGGEILSFPAPSEVTPRIGANQVEAYTQWVAQATVTKEQLAQIAAAKPSGMKLNFGENSVTVSIDAKESKQIALLAGCFAK